MRRANGTGSIVNLGPNRRNRYAVRISYQERPGLWKQRYLSYHRTAREAQEALENHLRENKPIETLETTLNDIYSQWSAKKYAKAGSASIASYKASWLRLSVLKGRPMNKITVDDLQEIIDQDEKNGLSKSSISNDKILMKALYKYAMERDIVSRDYSAFVELPTVGAKVKKGAFDEATIKRLWALADDSFPWADTVLILCYTGFRVSEFLGLTKNSYHGDYLQGGMKTAAGKGRIVPIHSRIKPFIDTWLSRNGKTIICGNRGCKISADRYRKFFSSVMDEIGFPDATPHWCRHTAASRMRMSGVDELALKRILGHSDANVTEHYTHLSFDFLKSEIEKVP